MTTTSACWRWVWGGRGWERNESGVGRFCPRAFGKPVVVGRRREVFRPSQSALSPQPKTDAFLEQGTIRRLVSRYLFPVGPAPLPHNHEKYPKIFHLANIIPSSAGNRGVQSMQSADWGSGESPPGTVNFVNL